MNLPKEDKRPRNGMWAPGSYWCKCVHCEEEYIGDKRSVCCADCAYSAPVFAAPHNTGEREPSEMPDSAGADAAVSTPGDSNG